MRLDALLDGVAVLEAPPEPKVEVTGLAHDSRRVRPGDLFVAVPGRATDGHRFLSDAAARGAVLTALAGQESLDHRQQTVEIGP